MLYGLTGERKGRRKTLLFPMSFPIPHSVIPRFNRGIQLLNPHTNLSNSYAPKLVY